MRVRAVGLIVLLAIVPARADPALDALVAAYPDHLAGYEDNMLIWKDGTRMPISDDRQNKSFDELLNSPDIKDQFSIPYPLGTELKIPGENEDPGRIRNEAFFKKMYGDCRNGEVTKRLRKVGWLTNKGGRLIMATEVNGVAEKLEAVSRDLEKLPANLTRYLVPSSGTFNCRAIAGTHRLSVHAYGAAIDLNSAYGDYWLWSKDKTGAFAWKNRLPLDIVEVFERHGFIWGGKWYHYDTFHFDYRPDIILLARRGWPRQ
ncbi:MAG: M15 family metallopeptidase [Rhizobiales bacterium]|nr:M15 family metallopeptidase [Hyphomicrobiales bacterium]